jgi:class 3 adenylate cyclase
MADEPNVPEEVERKLATILSADVVEYSRLMAEDEEQTVKTFRGHKQAFESLVTLHRGRVFNTAGDARLAEFGSAVEAVRCATEIQAALRTRNEQLAASRQVRFRIGVNLGDVMLQGSDLLGDGVNIAARLQSGAEPGGICISGSVYDQIRNKLSLSFRSMGEQKYKNIPQPVRTYSIAASEGLGKLPFAKQRWPSLHRSGARWLLGLVVLSLITVAAYGSYSAYQRWKTTGAQDGNYQGQVCLGPIPEEAARCYMTSNISVREGKISAKYPARDPALSNVVEGLISPSGEVRFELRLENSDGSRRNTAKLFGTLRDGRLTASGGTGNRTYNVDWHRF